MTCPALYAAAPDGVADFTTVRPATWSTVTVALESAEVTEAPDGSSAAASAVFTIEPAVRSACVTG